MAKDKKTIRFWLRSDRKNQDTTCPIHLVYQVKGVRKVFGIPDTHILVSNWNIKDQKAVYVKKEKARKNHPSDNLEYLMADKDVAPFNDKLSEIRAMIGGIETRFKLDGIQITPQLVIDKLKEIKKDTTKKAEPSTFIIDFIKQYRQDSKGSLKPRTLAVYEGLENHLLAFEERQKNRTAFETIDIRFLRTFAAYLTEEITIKTKDEVKVVNRMNNVSCSKYISTLKTILKAARTLYKIQVNQDYLDFKVSRKDSGFEVVTLTNEEFNTLFSYDLSKNKKLDQVRDVFCFACATGLRYSDLAQLKRTHIRHNVIRMTAEKTLQRLEIPLNPYSFAILEKYKDRHHPLPIISGQKTNKYLKELGRLAGIDAPVERVREYGVKKDAQNYKKWELMSIHMGRRTFTILSLEKGIAPQEVMALTGHTTFKAFKRYVDVTNDRKKTVMAQAWGEVKDTNLKAV